VGHPVAAGVITGVLTWVMGRSWVTGLVSLAAVAILGLALYPLSMLILERGRFVHEIQKEARLIKSVVVSQWEESR